jgi:NAD-dependent SIR2 family protein deacetylase
MWSKCGSYSGSAFLPRRSYGRSFKPNIAGPVYIYPTSYAAYKNTTNELEARGDVELLAGTSTMVYPHATILPA